MAQETPLTYEAFILILGYEMAEQAMVIAKEEDIPRGTLFMGHGTIKSNLLDFLGLNSVKRDMVLLVARKDRIDALESAVTKKLRLDRPDYGIAFALPVTRIHSKDLQHTSSGRKEDSSMYESIIIIVEKGAGKGVIEAARAGGSPGATLINAQGLGTEGDHSYFTYTPAPQQEILLILSPAEATEGIIKSIRASTPQLEDGRGLLFTMDVTRTAGLYRRTP